MASSGGKRQAADVRAPRGRSPEFFALLERAKGPVEGNSTVEYGEGGGAGVYIISVAARLVEMHPQTLRKYDREDLVSPSRTGGMLRLYSDDDVQRLRTIGRLVDEMGLNLDGVRVLMGVVGALEDVVRVLESSGEVERTEAGRLAVEELRGVIDYVCG